MNQFLYNFIQNFSQVKNWADKFQNQVACLNLIILSKRKIHTLNIILFKKIVQTAVKQENI